MGVLVSSTTTDFKQTRSPHSTVRMSTLLCLLATIVGSYALPSTFTTADRLSMIYGNVSDALFEAQAAPPSSSCKGWDWFYCPRDPGCATYQMSVHQVSVGLAPGHTTKVTVGKWTNLYVVGTTTMKTVPASATFKVYGVDGHNVAQGKFAARKGIYTDGPLGKGASLELGFENKPGQFRLQIPLLPTAGNFAAVQGGQWVNFGIDVFLEPQNTMEGMCVQVANHMYAEYMAHNSSQAFEMECKDNGDGTFTRHTVQPDVLHPLGGCNEFGKECDGCLTQCNPRSRAATLATRITTTPTALASVTNATGAEFIPCTPVGGPCMGYGQSNCCDGESCQATAPGSQLRNCIKM